MVTQKDERGAFVASMSAVLVFVGAVFLACINHAEGLVFILEATMASCGLFLLAFGSRLIELVEDP